MPVLKWFVRGFAIDVRSLAVFRMAMAAMVLVCLAERARDLTDHYTDWGVFPRTAAVALDHHPASPTGPWAWSLHMATGTTCGEALIFLVAALFAFWLLIGYRTHLGAFATWLLTVSVDHRTPLVNDVGDMVLRIILFWSMFLPLGAAASLDRRLRGATTCIPREILSLPGAALLLQMCMIYWASAAEKSSPAWVTDHTALYYAMSMDSLATPLGHWLLGYPKLLAWLTFGVRWLEWLGPVIAILPFGRTWLRLIVVLAFWAFHFGIALTMHLGALPWVSIATWCVFLPGALWDKLGWLPADGDVTPSRPARPIAWLFRRPEVPYVQPGWIAGCVVAALSLYVVVWNIVHVSHVDERPSSNWKVPAYVLGLEQTWRMFAPLPVTEDGWYEMRGILVDGSVVNLWQPDEPLPRHKPTNVAASYRNRRWQKYLVEIRRGWATFLPEFADWLHRRWDECRAGDLPERRLKHIEIVYHIEETLTPERTSSLIVPEIVYVADFANAGD